MKSLRRSIFSTPTSLMSTPDFDKASLISLMRSIKPEISSPPPTFNFIAFSSSREVSLSVFLTAVLVGASSAAFLCGLPIARSAAILRARSMGAVVKNVAALEALASIDCAFFDLSGPYFFDAHTTCRALWHRAIGCRILSENHTEAALTMAHRFGVATSVQVDTEAKTRIVQAARLGGARVLLVGHDDTARMIPVDVPIAVAPDALVGSVSSPIVLRESSLKSLVWLIDTARQLRSRKRLLLTMTLAYDVFVIPLCVAGFLAPMVAAALAFGVAWSSCRLASSIGSKPRR